MTMSEYEERFRSATPSLHQAFAEARGSKRAQRRSRPPGEGGTRKNRDQPHALVPTLSKKMELGPESVGRLSIYLSIYLSMKTTVAS
jgi:hypothetical protein